MRRTDLRKIRDDMAKKLFTVADMTYREFASFWSLDHTQLVRLVQRDTTGEEKGKDRK